MNLHRPAVSRAAETGQPEARRSTLRFEETNQKKLHGTLLNDLF